MTCRRKVIIGVIALGLPAALIIGAAGAQAQTPPSNVRAGSPPPPRYTAGGLGFAAGLQILNPADYPIVYDYDQWMAGCPSPPPDMIWQEYQQMISQVNQLQQQGRENTNQITNPIFGGQNSPVNSCAGGHGGPVSFSMYSAGFAGLDASSSRSSGFHVSDSAGLISNPSALIPGYRSVTDGGALNLSVDASRMFDLPANQRLWFGLSGDFHSDATDFIASALTPGGANANAGSMRSNVYTLIGSANYVINDFYLSGRASFDFNHAQFTNNLFVPGAQGDTNGGGYVLNATAGKLFPLINATGLNPATVVEASPANPDSYPLFLDASGHYAYHWQHEGGFTDNTGFVYGTQQLSYSDLGARARLITVVSDRDFAWVPFVGATVDQRLGLNYTFDIPAQTVTPADTLIMAPSTTYWGAELGVDLVTSSSAKFGIKAFYQASADTQTVGGSAFLKIPLEDLTAATKSNGMAVPAGPLVPVKAPYADTPALWNWAGFYLGTHVGGDLGVAKFSDPFGTPTYGDTVRSPGFLGGGQIGYNWQAPGSQWVFGVEADGSLMGSDGDATCFAVSSESIPSTCRVRPEATSTLTGRVGYTFGPNGRTMIYAKGGVAWANDQIDMALNTVGYEFQYKGAIISPLPIPSNSQSIGFWGGTVGLGVEHALTPAWSVKAEYDYVGFGASKVANLGSASLSPVVTAPYTILAVIPAGTSGVSQSFQEVKLGLNYKWGADPWAPGGNSGGVTYLAKTAAPLWPAAGWEVEGGGRYFGSWGEFHRDLGLLTYAALPTISDESRLNYDNIQTNSGEFFGRIETPWNLFMKGFIGGGVINAGHMNDEDFVLQFSTLGGYSNTLSPAVTGGISYGAIDAGYDFLRGPDYKVGAFAGYFHLNEAMNVFGCAPIFVGEINCVPNPVPTSGSPVVTENDKWDAIRIGVGAETMLTDRIKISADVAYLPWVGSKDLDQHFVGNTGVLAAVFPGIGVGSGVQVDAVLSYYLTPQWSIGVGGRYWGMWTTPNEQRSSCGFGTDAEDPLGCANPNYFKAQVEQLGAFVQTSYKFDWGSSLSSATPLSSGGVADMLLKAAAPPRSWSWTGFYLGVNGGGAGGDTAWTYTLPLFPTASHTTSGGLVGGTAGYNWQFTPLAAAGVDGDWDWADIGGNAECPNHVYSCQSKISDLGTARARLGMVWDGALIYATGGLAWGDVTIRTVNTSGAPTPPSGTPINGTTMIRKGYAAGAGVEYPMWNSLSLKLEWLHYDLGSGIFTTDSGQTENAEERGDMVRAGANYKFN